MLWLALTALPRTQCGYETGTCLPWVTWLPYEIMDPQSTPLIPGETEGVGPTTQDLWLPKRQCCFLDPDWGPGATVHTLWGLRLIEPPVKCTGSQLICVVEQEDCGGPGKGVNGKREDAVPLWVGSWPTTDQEEASISFMSLVFRVESPEIHRIFLVYKYPEFFLAIWMHIFEFQSVLLCLAVPSWSPRDSPQLLYSPKPFSTFVSQPAQHGFIQQDDEPLALVSPQRGSPTGSFKWLHLVSF